MISPLEEAYSRAMRLEVGAGVAATFCAIDDLIDLKSRSSRPQDLDDIAKLQKLMENNK